ncbi:MAG TPA: helix-turn-helix domain-containing protein [Streptosporangiaceae bacterium]|jgi:DNA-binding HxlR family transcriptional regulator
MPTSRSYGDACGIARALDVVGERWALLVLRELLFGPQRFSDLRRGLPGASSNLVADRLRELTARGVVQRRKLAPPAGSWVYELTEWGRELDPVIVALGNWGLRVPRPDGPVTLGPMSVLLYLRTAGRPAPGDNSAVQLDFDGRVWTARTSDGQVRIEAGEAAGADAVLRTDPVTLNALLEDPDTFDAALAGGSATVAGELAVVRRLIGSVSAAPA